MTTCKNSYRNTNRYRRNSEARYHIADMIAEEQQLMKRPPQVASRGGLSDMKAASNAKHVTAASEGTQR